MIGRSEKTNTAATLIATMASTEDLLSSALIEPCAHAQPSFEKGGLSKLKATQGGNCAPRAMVRTQSTDSEVVIQRHTELARITVQSCDHPDNI